MKRVKRILSFKNVFFFTVTAWFCWGCNDAVNDAITDNRAYIRGAYEQKISAIFLEGLGEEYAAVPVCITRRDDTRDIEVTVQASAEALDRYNKKYNKDYQMYPVHLWRFESETATIKKGAAATTAGMVIQPVPEELVETGDTYAIPVSIAKADGIGILEGSETLIYILRRTPRATVGGFANTGELQELMLPLIHEGNFIAHSALTIEFLIKLTAWKSAHNYALIYNVGGWGPGQGQIYSRIENGRNGLNAASFEWNIGDGEAISAFPPSGKIELGKWYHVAFTFGNGVIQIYIDGISMAKMDVARKTIECSDGYVWRGAGTNGGYGFPPSRNATMTSELRIWSVVRTQEQIQENMYGVNPKTPGLLGYWKMNDGSGSAVKDYAGTAHGYTVMYDHILVPTTTGLQWYTNEVLTVGQ